MDIKAEQNNILLPTIMSYQKFDIECLKPVVM
jgi:hypothetical protein